MSNLLPKSVTVTLEDGTVLPVRALTAVEILRMQGFLRAQLANMGEGKDLVDVLVDAVATHEADVLNLIAISTGKPIAWATVLSLPDMLTIAAELVTLNIAAQKKTPSLLANLFARLIPS